MEMQSAGSAKLYGSFLAQVTPTLSGWSDPTDRNKINTKENIVKLCQTWISYYVLMCQKISWYFLDHLDHLDQFGSGSSIKAFHPRLREKFQQRSVEALCAAISLGAAAWVHWNKRLPFYTFFTKDLPISTRLEIVEMTWTEWPDITWYDWQYIAWFQYIPIMELHECPVFQKAGLLFPLELDLFFRVVITARFRRTWCRRSGRIWTQATVGLCPSVAGDGF